VQKRGITIEQLKEQYSGIPFNQLINEHLKKSYSRQFILNAIKGTLDLLPKPARGICGDLVDRWGAQILNQYFWRTDTAIVLTQITDDARNILISVGAPVDDETLFNIFQIIVLNYAYNAFDQPRLRKIMGIESSAGCIMPIMIIALVLIILLLIFVR